MDVPLRFSDALPPKLLPQVPIADEGSLIRADQHLPKSQPWGFPRPMQIFFFLYAIFFKVHTITMTGLPIG